MRIACVDKQASARVSLVRIFDTAYETCRSAVGHLSSPACYPASIDELLINSSPDVVAVGPSFTVEEAYSACREIRDAYPHVPTLLFLPPESYSLRTLRRFKKVTTDVFSTEEAAIRIIHVLSSLETENRAKKNGKLIVAQGVKGGVGTTSIVSGLAHAAEALGKSAIVMDLSSQGAFAQYMGTQRWQSVDYAAALVDGLAIDKAFVEKCITTAANGITLLLPPAGGTDVRELWLRDASKFEQSLSIIDILCEMFDVVLVDSASVEGVLSFSLHIRADARMLCTSNDPASVHLLNSRLSELSESPGDSPLHILVNLLLEKGLTKSDIEAFLLANDSFHEEMALLAPIPFDAKGRNWIGTGNTFYTECPSPVQQLLEESLSLMLLPEAELQQKYEEKRSFFEGIRKIARRARTSTRRRGKREGIIRALPAPEDIITPNGDAPSDKEEPIESTLEREKLYHPPRLAYTPEPFEADSNQAGSICLEQALIALGSVLLAATAIPLFMERFGNYLRSFFS